MEKTVGLKYKTNRTNPFCQPHSFLFYFCFWNSDTKGCFSFSLVYRTLLYLPSQGSSLFYFPFSLFLPDPHAHSERGLWCVWQVFVDKYMPWVRWVFCVCFKSMYWWCTIIHIPYLKKNSDLFVLLFVYLVFTYS